MITIDLLLGNGSDCGRTTVSNQCSYMAYVIAPSTTRVDPSRYPCTSSAGSTEHLTFDTSSDLIKVGNPIADHERRRNITFLEAVDSSRYSSISIGSTSTRRP
jgi:hypothetical protein